MRTSNGAGRRSERRERTDEVVREHGLRELIDRRDRVAGRRRIGRIGLEQQRRSLAAHQPPREVGRNREHELRLAGGEHAVGVVLVARPRR